MSLRWVEGFEVRQTSLYFSRLYASASVGSIGVTGGRKAGRALISNAFSLETPPLVGAPTQRWFVQFSWRKLDQGGWSNGGTTNFPGLQFKNAAGVQCTLVALNSTDQAGNFFFELRRGTTTATIDTSPDFQFGSTKAWHVFILEVDVGSGGADGTYELRHVDFDGNVTVVFSGAGVDLTDQGSAGVDRVEYSTGNQAGPSVSTDEILIWDDVNLPVGTPFTGFPASTIPYVALGALPDGDGNQNDWIQIPTSPATNFDKVDDPATAVEDNSKVTSEIVGDIDLYTYENFDEKPAGAPPVRAVVSGTMAAMENSGTKNLQVRVRSGGAEADEGTAQVVTGLALTSELRVMEDNPVTVAAWTAAEVDAVEVGLRVQS